MSRTQRTSAPAPVANRQEDLVETALEALRREWRSGCTGRMVSSLALPSVQRLRQRAATQQAGSAIDDLVQRLTAYRQLQPDARKAELTELARALNALRPHLRLAEVPAAPVGTLPSAIAPVRAPQAPPKPRERSEQTPRVAPLPLDAPVTRLPRVGEAVAKKLKHLGIERVEDVLRLAPRRHIDYSRTERIGTLLGFGGTREVTVRGEITDIREIQGPGAARTVIKLADESGWVRVTWFSPYIAKQLRIGDEIAVSGTLDTGYGALSFTSPEWERIGIDGLSTGRLVPVYPLTQGLAQKTLRNLTRHALDATKTTIVDYVPEPLRRQQRLPGLLDAYEQLHYPDSMADLELAQRRLAFDNLLLLQLGLIRRKRQRQAFHGLRFVLDHDLLIRFRQGLPFKLTRAQEQALAEILADLNQPRPMARLLQGDVGSGKTVVAAAAILMAVANGVQSAMMAPTEILAEQHFHNIRGQFAHLPEADRPTVALLTGSTRAAERREILAAAASGDIDILVGTHALIQSAVDFARLGLVIVDEQHRFGVRQRAILPDKATGLQPHVLSMTATPIPRTLNMVLNGDLDVSIIAEHPPGRVPISTHRFIGYERDAAYDIVRTETAHGNQVFVICPLVEESESIEAKAAVAEAERLKREVFPDLRIAVLHGRMSGKDKDAIMTAFRDREYDILVSTSVIEVGIDVPNATVMLVEGADRFGLAQLHQFRGRVGRGTAPSYCLLLADDSTPEGEARLEMMVTTNDGFKLAEKDLELRGPGDFIGTRQSGLPEMSWIDGSFDTRLLDQARQTAERILTADPELTAPEHGPLLTRLRQFWATASPDVPIA